MTQKTPRFPPVFDAFRGCHNAAGAPMLQHMDLFGDVRHKNLDRVAPLAVRMRPRTLDEFVGQQHFLGPGQAAAADARGRPADQRHLLRPAGHREDDARAAHRRVHEEPLRAGERRRRRREGSPRRSSTRPRSGWPTAAQRTVLFLDEIHRFNRAQQDILLPDVEAGLVLLVGATTENPFFAVNSPLVSRSQIFQFAPLSEEDIRKLVRRAIADEERGFGKLHDPDRRRSGRPLGDDVATATRGGR